MSRSNHNRRDSAKYVDFSKFQSEVFIPSCVFNEKLSSFETIVKFLKESYGLSFQKISELLGKKKQSVWRAYKNAVFKFKESFEVTDLFFPIPVGIFEDDKLSVLESLVLFLKENYELKYSEISALIARDERTIWTVYSRARGKYEKSS